MFGRLLCLLGFHRWRWREFGTFGFYGEVSVCTRCDKTNHNQSA